VTAAFLGAHLLTAVGVTPLFVALALSKLPVTETVATALLRTLPVTAVGCTPALLTLARAIIKAVTVSMAELSSTLVG